jgi:hypothetical protein
MAPSTSNNTTGLTALAAAASSSAATGASSGRNMADDDASLDDLVGINDHHGAPEVQEVVPTKDPIEDASLHDVEFIDKDANEPQLPVQKAATTPNQDQKHPWQSSQRHLTNSAPEVLNPQ